MFARLNISPVRFKCIHSFFAYNNMSALSTMHTPRPPPTKRAKTEDSKTPKPRGIGLVIRSEDV